MRELGLRHAQGRAGDALGLGWLLCCYLLLGAHYALHTPDWQVPDEPAHYNYVAHLAERGPWPPVLEMGDYPFERLEALKAARFPPGSSIEGIDYEHHQPPAYYYLALPLYLAAGPEPATRLRAMRLSGLLLGCLTVGLTWASARLLWPGDRLLALGAAGFAAFLPMHLVMSAGVNNDALAYPVMAALIFCCLARTEGRLERRGAILLGGSLLGLATWVKVTLLLPAVGLLWAAERWAPERRAAERRTADHDGPAATPGWMAGLPGLLRMGIVALPIAAPWWIRNAWQYGPSDPLGLRAHARVVACGPESACQPRTMDWIAERGWLDLLGRMLELTFKSFWGVFGWMGVFLDRLAGIPIYPALAVVSLGAILGIWWALCALPSGTPSRASFRLLLLAVGLGSMNFLIYNMGYVQHQGRYLLPLLPCVALLFALGLRELIRRALSALGGSSEPPTRWSAAAASSAPLAFALSLAILSWLALERYVLPGLSP